ncbi:putative Paraflagellar rod protein [Trypanosoma vivax]|nr:putative Paraflagellar rod protein [Trypanosoma vivax]
MSAVDDATGLEAARKQKIHNLKLKTACLENEELVQLLHVSDWSETQRQKLRGAHLKAEELIAAVDVGTKWNLTEAYDLAKLMRVCGLEMSQRELYRPEDKAQFMDIIGVKKVLQDLKQNRNKTRVVSFTQMIDNAIAKMEKVEEELRRSQLDATQLAQVTTQTLKQIEDIMNVTQIQNALASTDDQIKTQLAQLEKTNEIQNVAMHDGEMQVAEEQMWTKVQLQERLIDLIQDKFRLIGKCEEENLAFNKIHEVQKQANQETSQMKEAKRRLKQRCETDLKHIHDAIQKADLEDAEATKRHAANREKSDRFIRENEDKQEETWNKIQDLERQLQKLGSERLEEVKRRIEEIDREEKRRVEYAQFLEVASQHKKLLELTVYNCDLAIRCTGMVEEMVSEGCAAVKARHDKTSQDLAALRLDVHKEHLEYFRMLYLTLGSLIYKKEKRMEEIDRNIRTTHIQLEFCVETFDPNAKKHADMKKELYKLRQGVEEELAMLKEKQSKALEDFKETEEALDAAGIEFNHPVDENNEEVLTRRSKMVEYRSHLTKQEEVKIAAEREEIKRARLLRTAGAGAGAGAGAEQHRIGDNTAPARLE